MIAHIGKRVAFIVTGYVAALVASTILVRAFTMFVGTSSFYVPESPSVLPPELMAFIFILVVLLIYAFLPALVLISAAEAFRWQRLWIYLVGSVLVLVVVTFLMSIPISTIGGLAASLSALLGGLIYWAVAGRQAGWPMKKVAP